MSDAGMVEKGVKYLSDIEIETKATKLRQDHHLDTIPVKVITLAERLGIEVFSADFNRPTIVGRIGKRNGVHTIIYRKGDPEIRKRFTIAHELGHYVLHLSDDQSFLDDEVNLYRTTMPENSEDPDAARREIQANTFAACLLMPARQVRQIWSEVRSIDEMARMFKVSSQAMGIRVAALGLE